LRQVQERGEQLRREMTVHAVNGDWGTSVVRLAAAR
jgi:hypothetical protein